MKNKLKPFLAEEKVKQKINLLVQNDDFFNEVKKIRKHWGQVLFLAFMFKGNTGVRSCFLHSCLTTPLTSSSSLEF